MTDASTSRDMSPGSQVAGERNGSLRPGFIAGPPIDEDCWRGRLPGAQGAAGGWTASREQYGQDCRTSSGPARAAETNGNRHQPIDGCTFQGEERSTRPRISLRIRFQNALREVLEAVYEQTFMTAVARPGRSRPMGAGMTRAVNEGEATGFGLTCVLLDSVRRSQCWRYSKRGG